MTSISHSRMEGYLLCRRPKGQRQLRMPRDRWTDMERFLAKLEVGDCWEWLGTKTHGYGYFNLGQGHIVRAHRWLYEQLVGPLPKNLDLDHLCKNRACVNPDHLEPVTRSLNLKRGENRRILKENEARRDRSHCKRGHLIAGDNLYVSPRGRRVCRECTRIRQRGEHRDFGQSLAA